MHKVKSPQADKRGSAQSVAAWKFGIVAGAATAERYVPVPLSFDQDSWNIRQRKSLLDEPLTTLAQPDTLLGSSFLGVIMGPAGVGKSELLRQLCRQGENNDAKFFPVRLSSCRLESASGFSSLAKDLTPGKLAEYLFAHLAAQASLSLQAFIDEAFIAIRERRMVLALDGLDEIIASREQHLAFFEQLWRLLATEMSKGERRGSNAGPSESPVRVLVTCRTDYAHNLQIYSRADFGPSWEHNTRTRVHFMLLDFFNPQRVRAYLQKQGVTDGVLQQRAERLEEEASGISEIMQRPLLLRLLCDLVKVAESSSGSKLPSSTTALLKQLTESIEAKQDRSPLWTCAGLAAASLQLYKRNAQKQTKSFGAAEFRLADVDQFMESHRETALTNLERMTAIQFCPFLRLDSETGVQFTHSVFYDYFVAMGMFLQVEEEQVPSRIDFDRYVLSPDMRRFLRGMLGEQRWRDRTAYSYCLSGDDALEHWPFPKWAREHHSDLERIRWDLLQFITDPESADTVHISAAINEFLDFNHTQLFPAYRMYNLEAVAVFIWNYQWLDLTKPLPARLQDTLILHLQQVNSEWAEHQSDPLYVDALERLVLRVLQIGRMLKIYQVVKKVASANFGEWIRDPTTKAEVTAIQMDFMAHLQKRP